MAPLRSQNLVNRACHHGSIAWMQRVARDVQWGAAGRLSLTTGGQERQRALELALPEVADLLPDLEELLSSSFLALPELPLALLSLVVDFPPIDVPDDLPESSFSTKRPSSSRGLASFGLVVVFSCDMDMSPLGKRAGHLHQPPQINGVIMEPFHSVFLRGGNGRNKAVSQDHCEFCVFAGSRPN
jgi:hypothetical protein